MVYVRKRELSFGEHVGGGIHLPTGSSWTSSYPLGGKVCDDVVGNVDENGKWKDNYFHLRTISYEPTKISGRAEAFPVYAYSSYPTAGQPGISHLETIDELPSELVSATQAAGDTNPGRPTVSVPVLIGELWKLPETLMQMGRQRGPQRPRNSSATGNFGWIPFFTDFFNLLRFTEHVEKRRKTLDKLYSKGGVSSKGRTWASQGHAIWEDYPLHTLEAYITGTVQVTTSVSRWAVCKWIPARPNIFSAEDLTQHARQVVHGWRLSPADVWELIPWSWFIDYFGNIGDFLQASDNSVAISAGPVCVMTHYRTTMSISVSSGTGGFSVEPGHATLDDKFRALSVTGLSATAPFLSARQLTNLVGIAANLGMG